ncbi:hypothetical protein TWF481_004051 [Arthrobotrys musiformis]|uniref:Uncharacterized protein n=1 Tax=Arthrobotrys musiformis TaxID=47236 RepID=A0AAV9WP53_9PEZI
MSVSPPYNITVVNNSSYTFTAIIRPLFLLPKNFVTPSPVALGPYSSQVYTATNDSNSIWFKISAPYTTTDLLLWATNDGSSWSAQAAWVTDLDSGPKVVPTDIYIVSNAVGSGGHTITIQTGAAKRGTPGAEIDSPVALAEIARARRFRA